MGDDEVELAGPREIPKIGFGQLDVRQSQIRRDATSVSDGRLRQIDSVESARGQKVRHWDQVAAIAAPEFENTALRDRRGPHPVQGRHRRETVGMRLNARVGGIADGLVSALRHESSLSALRRGQKTALRDLECDEYSLETGQRLRGMLNRIGRGIMKTAFVLMLS